MQATPTPSLVGASNTSLLIIIQLTMWNPGLLRLSVMQPASTPLQAIIDPLSCTLQQVEKWVCSFSTSRGTIQPEVMTSGKEEQIS